MKPSAASARARCCRTCWAKRMADLPQRGWFWQLQELPDAPESRYLFPILAGNDFQEGLKNYRDLAYLGSTLARWDENMVVYADMIDTRERAYAGRIPRVDALLASDAVSSLERAPQGDRRALQRCHQSARMWQRSARRSSASSGVASTTLEAGLAADPDNEETRSPEGEAAAREWRAALGPAPVLPRPRLPAAPRTGRPRHGTERGRHDAGCAWSGARNGADDHRRFRRPHRRAAAAHDAICAPSSEPPRRTRRRCSRTSRSRSSKRRSSALPTTKCRRALRLRRSTTAQRSRNR